MMMGQLLSDVWREAAWVVDGDGAVVTDGVVWKDGKKVDVSTGEPAWASEAVSEGKEEVMEKALEDRMRWHLSELDRRDGEVKREIEEEEAEQKRKITSEDMKEGWSQSSVAAATPSPLEDKPKPKAKAKSETIEVLNPGSVASVRFLPGMRLIMLIDRSLQLQPKQQRTTTKSLSAHSQLLLGLSPRFPWATSNDLTPSSSVTPRSSPR